MTRGRLVTVLIVVALMPLAALATSYVLKVYSHARWSKATKQEIAYLRDRCPNGMNKSEWEWEIDWLLNLHANTAAMPDEIVDEDARERFLKEFRQKVAEPVDIWIIDWIWIEYEKFTQRGKAYRERHRPTSRSVQ
jgi:hypothetical protein